MIKAVVVGINNYPSAALAGCVNDADDVVEHIAKLGALAADITAIKDRAATKSAIQDALRDMIAGARPGDHLLFHYSGHGSQVLSQDVHEFDQLDECLCPVDFDFADPDTAFRDKDLSAVLASVPAQVAMTVVLDSCHSGDMAREPKRSFPGMPQNILALVKDPNRPTSPKRRAYSANTVVVSACMSNETAADTAFQGRPNGAFTYYWLAELASRAAAPLAVVLTAVASSLGRYQMHPLLDGSVDTLQREPFLKESGEVDRSSSDAVTHSTEAFSESWSTRVFGMDFAVGLRIGITERDLDFDVTSSVGIPTRWSFAVDGDVLKSFELGLGFSIDLRVDRWVATSNTISFQLSIQITVPTPLLRATTLVDQRIVLPVQPVPRAMTKSPVSPSELLALIQLANISAPKAPAVVPPPVLPRDGQDQWTGIIEVANFVGGLFGCSYERNSGNNAYVPPGFIRDHVEVTLDPPGSGNVYLVDWADSDPHIGKFRYHVGCSAFGGGTATFFLHCIRDPSAIRQLPAYQEPRTNGAARAMEDDPPLAALQGSDSTRAS